MTQANPPSRHTRRWLLVVAVVGAGMYLAGLVTTSTLDVGRAALGRPEVGAGGVYTFDRARADDGYVTTGIIRDLVVNLVARDGSLVHSWHLDYELQGMATMYPDGSLIYMGAVPPEEDPPQLPPNLAAAGEIVQVSWNGEAELLIKDPLFSHDFTDLPDGTLAVLRSNELAPDFASRIAGGIPGTGTDGMWGNQIVEVDPTTKAERVVFDLAEVWRPEDHPIPDFMTRDEWAHANSIAYTPSDPLTHQEAYLVSFRTPSTILLVARASGEVIWSYGGPWVLNQQHDATFLPDGHILLFDNGQYRRGLPSASQLLEIDAKTDQITWSYDGYGIFGTNFYSPITGGAQRLPNGNTLATLGTPGRLMEVTPDGDVVWDYRVGSENPDPAYPEEPWNFLFKSRSYPASEVEPLLGS